MKCERLKKIRISFITASILFLLQVNLKGQDSARTGSWLSLNVHYGFILPLYNSSMNILIQGHVPALELDYIYKPNNANNWLNTYHCPETGIAFFSAYLSNPAQLGNMYGVYPFIDFHLKRSFKERLYFRVGIGLGYMPLRFDPLDNHKNDVIGTRLNAIVNLKLNYHFYLSDKIRLEAGVGLTHCSNGAFQTPDLGINIITVNTGISYCITNAGKSSEKPFIDTLPTKKIENTFYAVTGLSEVEPPGGQKYTDISLSYIHFYRLTKKSKLGYGADIFYNEANIARLRVDSIFLKNKLEVTQFGLKAAYELCLGNLSLPLEMGGYVYTKFTGNGYFYNRLGVRYYAGKHFIANLTLLTHFVKADFIEWGVGYKI